MSKSLEVACVAEVRKSKIRVVKKTLFMYLIVSPSNLYGDYNYKFFNSLVMFVIEYIWYTNFKNIRNQNGFNGSFKSGCFTYSR